MGDQSMDCRAVDIEQSKYRNEHIACISSSIMPCFYGKYTIQFNYIICCSLRQGFQQGQTILKQVPLFFFFKRANQKGFVILKSLRGNYEWFCAIQKWKIPPQSPKSSSLFCFKIMEVCCFTYHSRYCCMWISQMPKMKMYSYKERWIKKDEWIQSDKKWYIIYFWKEEFPQWWKTREYILWK